MTKAKPHVGVQFVAQLPRESIDHFARDINHPGLIYLQDEREDFGIYAGLEWLVPTAVVVYLAKPYFTAFLSEAGKDHYQLLRKALVELAKRYIGAGAPQLRAVSAGGKAKEPSGKYSLVFSVVADLDQATSIKLLIESDLEHAAVEQATEAFLDFIKDIHLGQADFSRVVDAESARISGRILLVKYDQASKALIAVDPIPQRNEPEA
ncbi:MAG: hypothetical protein LWW81_05385 [Rhodocyclales bacterium]|nr:hypothetical protein [Rhodocyclales bacterium]